MIAVIGKQWVAATRGLPLASKPSSHRLAQQMLRTGARKQNGRHTGRREDG